jgi:hypothetical protein
MTSAKSTSTPRIISTDVRAQLQNTYNQPYTMSLSCQNAARSCIRSLRSSSSLRISSVVLAQRRNTPQGQRWASTDAASNPKVTGIVDQISQLTLLETADLVASLKVNYSSPFQWCLPSMRKSNKRILVPA